MEKQDVGLIKGLIWKKKKKLLHTIAYNHFFSCAEEFNYRFSGGRKCAGAGTEREAVQSDVAASLPYNSKFSEKQAASEHQPGLLTGPAGSLCLQCRGHDCLSSERTEEDLILVQSKSARIPNDNKDAFNPDVLNLLKQE